MMSYDELKIKPSEILSRGKWNGLVEKVEARDQEILEALTITADKKIGIGTSSPAVALDIEGSIRLGNRPGGGNNLYLTDHTEAHHYIGVHNWWTEFVSHPNEGWRFKAKANKNPLLTIKARTGNVGIGTTEPRNMLHVKGNAGILNMEGKDHVYIEFFPLGVPAGRKGWLGFGGANIDKMAIVNESRAPLALGTNRNEMLFLRENGKIGIHTENPKSSLHIKGNAGILNLEGENHGYIQFYPDTFAKGRKAWLGFGSATTETFTIRNSFRNGKIDLHGELIFRTLTSRRSIPEFSRGSTKFNLKFKIDARKLSFGYGEIYGKSTFPLSPRPIDVKKKGLMIFLDGKLINFFESDESYFARLQP